jgi:hypothetical protein
LEKQEKKYYYLPPPLKIYRSTPTIIAMTRILGSPAIAIIPKIDRTQIKINTTAICLKGLGKLPTSQIKTRKIRTSQIVMENPLNLRRIM